MTRCKGTNKAGKPCKAAPAKGTGWCRAHDPDAPPSTRFGSTEQATQAGKLGGRPPLPRPTDAARALIEENTAVVLRPHFRALGYDVVATSDGLVLEELPGGGAKLHGTEQRSGEIVLSEYDDLGAQIAAADKLQDRVYGRPKQATELTGPGGGPIDVQARPDLSKLSADELHAFRALLEKASHTPTKETR